MFARPKKPATIIGYGLSREAKIARGLAMELVSKSKAVSPESRGDALGKLKTLARRST